MDIASTYQRGYERGGLWILMVQLRCSATKNQAHGYKGEIKENGKRQIKRWKKKQGKDERETSQHHHKLNFACALVGLHLWRSTSTHSITQDMAALLMHGVGEGGREGG